MPSLPRRRDRLLSRTLRGLGLMWMALALACSTLTPGTPAPTSTPPTPIPVESSPTATDPASPTSTPDPTAPPASPAPDPTTRPVPPVNRIGVRVLDGVGEFYDTVTGEKFTPRGVNYVDFYPTERGGWEDRSLGTATYDPARVRAAFEHLAAHGYNTVRFFFDTCGFGPTCIGNPGGAGLNPRYLDNLADMLHIAAETGIYLILTANSVPEEGGYWTYFDNQINNADRRFGFESYQNSDWLHPAGVEIKRRFWHDLLGGLVERGAPFAPVLGWQLTNELWLFKLAPPLSLNEGLVTIATEQTYDMADPDQKRQMVVDGVLFNIEEIVGLIKSYDPQALTTVGFFAPQFPNPTGIGGDWYVDTAPLVAADPPVDFWDFHAYYDGDLSIEKIAENFGMPGHAAKPVVMGETGSGQAIFPSAYSGLSVGLRWIADSCAVGFDGWLNWGYFPWPEEVGGKPWTFLDQDGALMQAMAPINQPDPCVVPALEAANVALGRPVRYSRQLPDQPASAAVDGRSIAYGAGDYPPQWVEVQLDAPTAIQRVGMTVSQWPPGLTRHQVWARLASGAQVLVAEFYGFTTVEINLAYDLPLPLPDVTAVRFLTLESPSWVGWTEVEVISSPPGAEAACLGTASAVTPLRRWPGLSHPAVSQLAAGEAAYLDGRATADDGSAWRRVGAGLWAVESNLSLAGACDSAALNGQPLPLSVPVTFDLTAPAGTLGEVFIAGRFPGTQLPAWVPYSILLLPQDDGLSVTVDLPVGSGIEYVYTRGSFDTIERPASCGEPVPRRVTVAPEPMRLEDTVVKWRDEC